MKLNVAGLQLMLRLLKLSITENANVAGTAKLQSRYKAINISTKPF